MAGRVRELSPGGRLAPPGGGRAAEAGRRARGATSHQPEGGRETERAITWASVSECVCTCAPAAASPLLQRGLLRAQERHFLPQQADLPLVVTEGVQPPPVDLQLLVC